MANFSNTLSSTTQTSTPQTANGLLRPTNPATSGLTWGNVKPLTPTPPTPTPSTPLKSHTVGADGSSTSTYHAPATGATPAKPKVLATTQTQSPAQPEAPTTAQPVTPAPTQPTYANPLIQPAMDAQNRAVNINQALNQGINDRTKQGIALPFVQGQQAALERDYGVQAQAANQAASNATTLAGFGQPQVAGYGQTAFNPLSGSFGTNGSGQGNGTTQVVPPNDPLYPALQSYAQARASGQESLIPGSISGNPALNAQLTEMATKINPSFNANTAGANANTVSGLQTQINTIESTQGSANSNFDALIGYGQKFDANTPIVTGLKQLFAGTAGGDVKSQQAIAGFQSSLANIQQQYKDLTGADPISAGLTPNVTPAALAQIKKDMQDKITNSLKNKNDELTKLKGSGSTGASGGTANDPLGIL